MTVAELIEALQAFPMDAEVRVWDGCEDEWMRSRVTNVRWNDGDQDFVMVDG